MQQVGIVGRDPKANSRIEVLRVFIDFMKEKSPAF